MPMRLKELHFGAEVTLSDGQGLEVTGRGRIASTDDADIGVAEFEDEEGAAPGPETLLAMGHAICFISALVSVLEEAGHPPSALTVRSVCTLSPREDEGGYRISEIRLRVAGDAQGLSAEALRRLAEEAEDVCPISGALAKATPVRLALGS